MIDISNMIRDYTDNELEELAVFSILVAGKTARTIEPRINKMSEMCYKKHGTLFNFICRNKLGSAFYLKHLGIGCYNQKGRYLQDLVNKFPNGSHIRASSIEDLERVKGIGQKTSRLIYLYGIDNTYQAAILDTHVLKYLKSKRVRDVPNTTPKGKEYLRLEKAFVRRIPKDKTAIEFDYEIWKSYAKIGEKNG